jgi:Protein of unknown function (DUF3553)
VADTGADEARDLKCVLCQPGFSLYGLCMSDMNAILTPGMRVRHPQMPEWGVGQVQSNIGGKITVNFPEAGKVVIEGARIELQPVFDAE